MNKCNYITLLIISFKLLSCGLKDKQSNEKIETRLENNLKVDHLNIWVEHPEKAKQLLIDIGFTTVPDSDTTPHQGQGTSGKYFHFLNSYLELIFVYDQQEFDKNNETNTSLDFSQRANFHKNNALPFSVALKLKEYSPEKIPFETIKYQQAWMGENNSIYVSKNAKTNLQEPSVFVVYPDIESGTFQSMSDLDNFPTNDDHWKSFFKHPNGAKKITKITITTTDLDLKTETIQAVNSIDNIAIKNGAEHLMELYFDDNIQRRSFDLRPELPLIIYL
ncbi:hypothetical protein HN014_13320 [Aquimarina sp. TRL1]|uniref:hypothetical protein n=1 Tax=Aquimarina sp. (strain TRL1) TaxID=2736252 RepID=UPI00158A762B|nr:hypothetical protein [Aquimarina sp. TRL1]QKX05846.1 hypothetical protein HN014_13320 [Aquimarina sp. TRL1]